jgi:hypothetical protein
MATLSSAAPLVLPALLPPLSHPAIVSIAIAIDPIAVSRIDFSFAGMVGRRRTPRSGARVR